MQFVVLGPFQVLAGGVPIPLSSAHKPRLLLAALLTRPGRPVTMDALVAALWPDFAPPSARRNLQLYVHQLRGVLGPDSISTESFGYTLNADDEVDAVRFQRLARDGAELLKATDTEGAREMLRAAIDLWRGEAFAGFLDCEPIAQEAGRLEQLRLATYERWAEAALATGHHAEVVDALTELAPRHPFRETLTAHLMAALVGSRSRAAALEVFTQARAVLRDQLGIDPSQELQQLHLAILRGEEPAAPPTDRVVPRQLPRDLLHFTGRRAELSQLIADLDRPQTPQTVLISAIDGMAGVGKTTLALHAAHALAQRYPDGQLFLDLHAHTQGRDPVEPAEALNTLLRSVGVPGERIPAALDERAALWRTETADRRLLVLLDNAASTEQVTPLLPGAKGCLVLVTARRRLPDLDTARPLALDVLPHADAVGLFTAITGDRVLVEQEAVNEVVQLCGRLPLAVRIIADRLRQRPMWTVAHLAKKLRDERRRLSELSSAARSVASAFALSYQHLGADEQRMFRLLGLHPGADVDAYAAAALSDLPVDRAEDLLESLLDVHLLQQRTLGRYTFHDLLRDHARACVQNEESGPDRDDAVHRMLDFYLAATRSAADQFYPGRMPIDLELTYPPTATPPLDGSEGPSMWFATEQRNLVAAINQAIAHDLDRHAWLLPREMCGYLMALEYLDDCIATQEKAVEAARRLGDRQAEQICLLNLAKAYGQSGRMELALRVTHSALEVAEEIGNRHIQGFCNRQLGSLYARSGRFAQAMPHLDRSLVIIAEVGPRVEECFAHTDRALVLLKSGRYDEAHEAARQVAQVARECSNAAEEANGLVLIAMALTRLSRHDEALEQVERGLAMASEAGRPSLVVDALRERADIRRRVGQLDQARADLEEAVDIVRGIGQPEPECEIQLAFGRFHATVGDPVAARESFDRALVRARQLGYRFEQAEALAGIGRALSAIRDSGAYEYWNQALDLYAGMGIAQKIS